MEVKIYREPENENLIINEDDLKQYNDLAIELGLPVKNAEEEKTPNVYMPINDTVQRHLQALCPMKVRIEDYKRPTIPLEVLKVYKFAKENEMFDGYAIWYDDKETDSLLIGWNWQSEKDKKNDYSWRHDRFLIARWGDCAMELPELIKKGRGRIENELKSKATLLKEKCESVLNNIDSYTDKCLTGDNILSWEEDLKTSAHGTINSY